MKINPSCGFNKFVSRGRGDARIPRSNQVKEASLGDGSRVVRYTLNTIIGGFIRGGETSSARRRYAPQILNIEDLLNIKGEGESKALEAAIAFFEKDVVGIHPYNDDHMVITVKRDE